MTTKKKNGKNKQKKTEKIAKKINEIHFKLNSPEFFNCDKSEGKWNARMNPGARAPHHQNCAIIIRIGNSWELPVIFLINPFETHFLLCQSISHCFAAVLLTIVPNERVYFVLIASSLSSVGKKRKTKNINIERQLFNRKQQLRIWSNQVSSRSSLLSGPGLMFFVWLVIWPSVDLRF